MRLPKPADYAAALTLAVILLSGIAGAQHASAPDFTKNGGGAALPSPRIDSPLVAPAGATLPNWTGTFTRNGTTYTYSMLGTDPTLGSRTTTINATLIPLKLVFSDGTILDASAPANGQTKSAVQLTQQSPLFNAVTFVPGGTNVGTTQYIDAFQRANFWNAVKATSPNYHVRFKLTTMPMQTLTVPAFFGVTQPISGGREGFVDLIGCWAKSLYSSTG